MAPKGQEGTQATIERAAEGGIKEASVVMLGLLEVDIITRKARLL